MACFVSSFAPANLLSARRAPRPLCRTAHPHPHPHPHSRPAPCTTRHAAPRMSVVPPLADPPFLQLADFSDVNRGPLFATAFVFFLTFWGSISFVKGSTKDRITQASFTLSEQSSDIAKKTARYLMQRSFKADPSRDDRNGVMTFVGEVRASSSVAAILVAVAASAIWAATYILNFVLPPSLQSNYWWLLTLGSFAVVPWYRKQANREEWVKLMVEQEDDGTSTLYVKGHRDEIEELEKAFSWKRNEPVYEGDEEKKADKTAEPEPAAKK